MLLGLPESLMVVKKVFSFHGIYCSTCMFRFLKRARGLHTGSLSFYADLIDHCFSSKSLDFAKLIHAQLIKVGFNSHTFLGNRCIDLYSKLGSANDALQAFNDIRNKNIISWNICLRVLVRCGDLETALNLFERMPEQDVVTWNSMMSGYSSNGFSGRVLELFVGMQNVGMMPNEFTFSILASSLKSANHAKQIHGNMMRRGVNLLNVVVGNSLIDMYATIGLMDYAFGVFLTMEEIDVISWNSLISSCCKLGYGQLALNQFCLMISSGYVPDEFTMSTVIAVCTVLQDLEKGKQILAFCFKKGFLSNTIVSSAAIDLFSKCNRLEDSIMLFEELVTWDSVVCNSMISSYARHGFGEDALQLFVLTLRDNLRPIDVKDLISWNTMIFGFTENGRVAEALEIFKDMLEEGLPPDRITLAGVLLACSYGLFVDEGMRIFSSMEKAYGIMPRHEHYLCVMEMMIRAGKLKEAVDIIEAMPHEPSPSIWESILRAYGADRDLKLTERVAERLLEYKPHASFPYLVLVREYEMRGRWESMVRIRKLMEDNSVSKVIGCSWIGIRKHIFAFRANNIFHYEQKDIYLILGLLMWEMDIEASDSDLYHNVSAWGEQA
ncbi:pentatricopeptide repeat-containing protein At1g43980, mitochondrial [Diospyros lotus]|uniref:pentatricopeptide repeat-containing protein At1g43980, mitochondrial n=1 Tax=Diospyros lotus TaxID=55363 RepID=UPI00224E905A|nr:pentatricopeptide repeat-containing protein At1g43980, mitochondrial [Diospyros lotus]